MQRDLQHATMMQTQRAASRVPCMHQKRKSSTLTQQFLLTVQYFYTIIYCTVPRARSSPVRLNVQNVLNI